MALWVLCLNQIKLFFYLNFWSFFPFIFIINNSLIPLCASTLELSLTDILTTPSLAKPNKDYFRTPGQVLSLISSLGFVSIFFYVFSYCLFVMYVTICLLYLLQNTPVGEGKRHCSASAVSSPVTCGKRKQKNNSLGSPIMKRKDDTCSPGQNPWRLSMFLISFYTLFHFMDITVIWLYSSLMFLPLSIF